jgi:hypothetical protein
MEYPLAQRVAEFWGGLTQPRSPRQEEAFTAGKKLSIIFFDFSPFFL